MKDVGDGKVHEERTDLWIIIIINLGVILGLRPYINYMPKQPKQGAKNSASLYSLWWKSSCSKSHSESVCTVIPCYSMKVGYCKTKQTRSSKAALLLIAEIHSTHKVANQQCREEARVYEQTKHTKPQY